MFASPLPKRLVFALPFTLAALLQSSPPIGATGYNTLTITNVGHNAMTGLYVSRSGQNQWGRNWIQGRPLLSNQGQPLTIPQSAGCRFDVKAVFDPDNHNVIVQNTNVCGPAPAVSMGYG
jgi:hypothetical protein